MKFINLYIFIFFISFSSFSFAEKYEYIGKIQSKKSKERGLKYDIINLIEEKNVYVSDEEVYVKNIRDMQLSYIKDKPKIIYGKTVNLKCKDIYMADSFYHFTDIICIVDKISYR